MAFEIKFVDKQQSLSLLREMHLHWKNIIQTIIKGGAIKKINEINRSIKDDIAHLKEWQRFSLERVKCAIENNEPKFDWLPEEWDLESEESLEEINEWIYNTNLLKDFSTIANEWDRVFTQLLVFSEKISQQDLLDMYKFPWSNNYPLLAVLEGTYDHHREHLLKLDPLST